MNTSVAFSQSHFFLCDCYHSDDTLHPIESYLFLLTAVTEYANYIFLYIKILFGNEIGLKCMQPWSAKRFYIGEKHTITKKRNLLLISNEYGMQSPDQKCQLY